MNKWKKGFSIIEVVIVMVVLGTVATMAIGLLEQGVSGTFKAEALDELDWKAREGFERLSRELRNVNPKNITALSSTGLTYTSVEGESVVWAFSGSTLTRNGTALIDGISSFSFAYYTGAGAVTAVGANVRLIQYSGIFTQDSQTSPNYITAVALVP